jgi:hypothetical protein
MRSAVLAVLMFGSSFAVAQDNPMVGKWSGSYVSGKNTTVRVVLDVKNVDGEKIQGTGTLYSSARRGGECSGEYSVEGTLKGKELRVRSTEKGGPAGDCNFNLAGTLEGNKLLAKRGQNEFEMTK